MGLCLWCTLFSKHSTCCSAPLCRFSDWFFTNKESQMTWASTTNDTAYKALMGAFIKAQSHTPAFALVFSSIYPRSPQQSSSFHYMLSDILNKMFLWPSLIISDWIIYINSDFQSDATDNIFHLLHFFSSFLGHFFKA